VFPPASAAQDRPVAITSVTVIPGTGAPAAAGQTVVIQGGRIRLVEATHASPLPTGRAADSTTQVIDGTGRYLIPGLWDLHTHLIHDTASLGLYLANGVTAVRDMGGPMDSVLRVRERVRRGELPGPRMWLAGPTVDGPKDARFRLTVRTAAEGVHAVDSLAARAVDVIKMHNAVPPEAFFAVVRRARERGIPVGAHLPAAVTPAQASDAWVTSIEHTVAFLELAIPRDAQRSLDGIGSAAGTFLRDSAGPLWARMKGNGTWVVPTLIAARGSAERLDRRRDFRRDLRAWYVSRMLERYWDEVFPVPDSVSALTLAARYLVDTLSHRVVAAMHRAGVGLATGTDVALPGIVPGFSLHDELAMLVEAGLTPLEAIQAGTLNAARVAGAADSLGSIEVGKVADLVLLEADPLADIRHTARVAGVMVGGRWMDRRELDRLLAQSRAWGR
jgi:imidazolonepropionase-like amidohydrolase